MHIRDGWHPRLAELCEKRDSIQPTLAVAHVPPIGGQRHPPPAAKRVQYGVQWSDGAHQQLGERRQVSWTVAIDQHFSVAIGQAIASLGGSRAWVVDLERANDGLLFQPFTCVALVSARPLRQVLRGGWAVLRKRAIQAEPIADIRGEDVEHSRCRTHEPLDKKIPLAGSIGAGHR